MTHTDELRRQHDAATQLMAGITGQIGVYRGPGEAYLLTLGIAQLLGLLRNHLTQEDEHLYPELINSHSPRTAALARRFAREMGDLAMHLEEYALHWSTSAAISAYFDEFREETITIFTSLNTRIRRENRQLYPLADRLAGRPLRPAAWANIANAAGRLFYSRPASSTSLSWSWWRSSSSLTRRADRCW